MGQFTVGYVGCSDTWMTIQGYYNQTNEALFWPANSAYSGGGIDNWGWANASTSYWDVYDNELSAYGQPKAVWVEDCGSQGPAYGQFPNDTYAWSMIQQFFGILKAKSPNAVVYMSPINNFLPNGTCPRAGLVGVPQTERMTKLAVADGLALAGPIMGPLVLNGTLDSSRCHPNTAGELLLGSQLVQFFGGLSSLSNSSSSATTTNSTTATTSTTTTTMTITATKTMTKRTTITHSTTQMETTALSTTTTQPTTITQPMTITQPTTIAQTTTTQTETTTQLTTIIQSTTQTETTTQLTTITTSAASTYAYVSLGATTIVILTVAALAAWVLRGRRPS